MLRLLGSHSLGGDNFSLYFFDIDRFSSRRSLIALVYLISISASCLFVLSTLVLFYVLVIRFWFRLWRLKSARMSGIREGLFVLVLEISNGKVGNGDARWVLKSGVGWRQLSNPVKPILGKREALDTR